MYNFNKIYSSNFNKVYIDTKFSMLKVVALPETTSMDDCAYREELLEIMKAAQRYSPEFCLINNSHNKFQVSSDLQSWQLEQIKKLGICKNAIVINAEFILQSMQQPLVQEATGQIPFQYFTNEEDALLWLVGTLDIKPAKKIVT